MEFSDVVCLSIVCIVLVLDVDAIAMLMCVMEYYEVFGIRMTESDAPCRA